jgi:hypothetical protein
MLAFGLPCWLDGRLFAPILQMPSCTSACSVLVASSGSDEYAPQSVDIQQLLVRLCYALNGKFDPLLEKLSSLPNENEAHATTGDDLPADNGADAALFVRVRTIGQLLLDKVLAS